MTTSLRQLLDVNADTHPDAVALDGDAGPLTWASLRDAAREVAAALVRDRVAPQDRVVYVGKNDPRYFSVLFGCALAGAVLTPLNWRLAPHELAAMIDDSTAPMVFVDQHCAEAIESVATRLPAVRTVVVFGEHARWPSLARWVGPAVDPEVPAGPEDIAFQLYTSGTTGQPKGAMFANGTNLRVLLDDISVAWGFTANDTSLLCMPLFHMGGLAWALAGMARGARSIVVSDFVPAPVLDTIDEYGVTMAFCVPTMLTALYGVPGIAERPLKLRQMVYSGSPISATALHHALAALRCDFVQIYGLTEATGAFAQLSAEEHRADDVTGALRSAGRPYSWVEVRVVDPATLVDVPDSGVGEIWTRSAQNMVGYWHRPEETAAALCPDGWLRTGDLGRQDAQGRLYLVDHAKDLVITGGENVYPAEVEDVLAAHPGLAEVAVIGVPDDRWGETIKALAVPMPGAARDTESVIEFARARLARFKCPTSVDWVDTLPLTATGKVIKSTLREPYWRDHDRLIN